MYIRRHHPNWTVRRLGKVEHHHLEKIIGQNDNLCNKNAAYFDRDHFSDVRKNRLKFHYFEF